MTTTRIPNEPPRVRTADDRFAGVRIIQELWQDSRYALRLFWKSPGFTLISIVMLALGIGANTAIFSVIRTVLVRPLPYRDEERLVWLSNRNPELGVTGAFLNPADIIDYRNQSKSFADIAAWGTLPVNLYGARSAERVEGIYVTTNFFRTLGVQLSTGRDFAEGNEPAESVIISYRLWQRQFGGDTGVIGRKINLGLPGTDPNQHSIVVGVLPPEIDFPQRVDLFTVGDFSPTDLSRGGSHNSRTIARLNPGVTVEQAQAEISALSQRLAEQYPDTNEGWDVAVVPFRDYLFGSWRTALPLLFGAVGFVLLIACANVANLQLVRGLKRRKEIAIRLALGAGRGRVIRQLLVESLLVALCGAAAGLLIANLCLAALHVLGPSSIPRLLTASLDVTTVKFAIAVAVVSAIVFGLVPALHASRSDISSTLRDSPTLGRTPLRADRFRRALVVGQISLALILLTGAGLVIKSYWKLQAVNPGFKADNVLTAGLSLSFADYPNGSPRRTLLYHEAVDRLAALPGVTAVGAISHLPFGGRTMQLPFHLKGEARLSDKNEAIADYRVVTPSLFKALGVAVHKGRTFDERDRAGAPQVFVVNEAFARTYLPGRDPIGAQLDGETSLVKGEIIGVVEDVKHKNLETEATPTFYVSYLQSSTFPIMNFIVRTQSDQALLALAVERQLKQLDADAIVFNVRPYEDFIADSVAPHRFNLWLLAAFAGLAVVLAIAGIYGTMSYAVAQRTREIGIRLAIGAQPADVLKLIIGEGLKLIVVGVIIGLFGSFVVTRWIKSLLFEVAATDPLTYSVIAVLVITIALIACWLPARRATRVNPLIAVQTD